jgi:hypothetical protein
MIRVHTPARRPLDKPFELFLLLICVLYGLLALLGGPRPQSLQETVSGVIIIIWGWMLLVGGAVAFAGLFWRGRYFTSFVLEQFGLILTGTATLIYALAVLAVNPHAGLFAGFISIAFSLSCYTRIYVLRRYNKALAVEHRVVEKDNA